VPKFSGTRSLESPAPLGPSRLPDAPQHTRHQHDDEARSNNKKRRRDGDEGAYLVPCVLQLDRMCTTGGIWLLHL